MLKRTDLPKEWNDLNEIDKQKWIFDYLMFGSAAIEIIDGQYKYANIQEIETKIDDSIPNKIIEILKDYLGVEKVELNHKIVDDLKVDSLDIVELVIELEDQFDIEVPDEDVETLKTVKDVVNYVQEIKR